jgi:hopanoid C-3 methylase
MKVLLVRPPAPNKLSFTKILDNEPLELEYLHTVLSNRGHKDYIYDGLIETASVEAVILREKPDVIAITGYITQEKLMLDFCRKAKEINGDIITIIGGVHAQLNHQRFYDTQVDYIMRSESMDAFGLLMETMARKSKDELGQINGLCYQGTEGWVENILELTNINDLPIPDRTFFQTNKHHYRYLDLTEVATIKTALSCPFKCNFCYCTLLNGGHYQTRELPLVIEELKTIDAENIQIVDDDFLVDPERIEAFIQLIRENKIKKRFICYARADFVASNPAIIEKLVEIGFYYFLVGLEAVSDNELAGYNKSTTKSHNEDCVQVIREAGGNCIGLMIVPLDADKEYFETLYQWIVSNKLLYVTVSIFTPIPGTPLYEEYKDRLMTQDIEAWDFLHLVVKPEKLSARAFYRQYLKLFLRLYKIAKASGIYDFMDLAFYMRMLRSALRRKIVGG